MKTVEIVAYSRKDLRRTTTRKMRREGNVPCVVYGNSESQTHIYIPGILFRPLLRSQEAKFVDLNVEGKKYTCLLQDIQYHPVGDYILHADFLRLGKKAVTMSIPVRTEGNAPGLTQGGKLHIKTRTLKVKAQAEHMPAKILVDISTLHLGEIIRVQDLPSMNYQIIASGTQPIVSIEAPRKARISEETTTEVLAASDSTSEESTEVK